MTIFSFRIFLLPQRKTVKETVTKTVRYLYNELKIRKLKLIVHFTYFLKLTKRQILNRVTSEFIFKDLED